MIDRQHLTPETRAYLAGLSEAEQERYFLILEDLHDGLSKAQEPEVDPVPERHLRLIK